MLLLGSMLLGHPAAQAQATSVLLSDSAAQAARDDTAVAVQRLFYEQRHRSRRDLLLGGISVASAVALLATSPPAHTTYQHVATGAFALVAGYYAWRLAGGVVLQRRYRRAREQRLLAALELGQPLPRRVRQRLGAGYFSVRTFAR